MSKHLVLSDLTLLAPFLILALAVALLIRKRMTSPLSGGLFTANLCGLDIADPLLEQRVTRALQERRRLEAVPFVYRIVAAVWIAAGILAMLACGAKLLPHWWQSIAYGVLCIGLSLLMLGAYVRIRNAQPVRVAFLARRVPTDVIPMPWFVLAVLSACSTLLGLTDSRSGAAFAAAFVCFSALATTAVAWGMTGLPARLAGEDVEIEQFIDQRVRFNRSAKILLLVFAQTFIYFVQANLGPENSILMLALVVAELALYIAYFVWMMQRRKMPLRLKRAA
jgi:hypothetical protein